jgi:hypothetical protein
MSAEDVGFLVLGMVAGGMLLALMYGVSRSLGSGGPFRGLEPSPGYMRARARAATQRNGSKQEVKRG